jgi:gliding motility-associated-like protein
VVVLTLSFKAAIHIPQNINGCVGDTLFINNQIITKAGIYQDTIHSALGCDTVMEYTVIFNQTPDTAFLAESICAGEYFTVNNQQFNQPGTYFIPVPRQNKCDSVVVLTLSFKAAIHISQNINGCVGDTLFLNNQIIIKSGIYQDPIHSALGCDTVREYTVTFNQTPDTTFLAESICAGEYFTVNNQQFNQPGTYFIPVPRQNKCDSVVVLTLSFKAAIHIPQNINGCIGDTLFINNQFITKAGIYQDTIHSALGCDTIREYTVTFNQTPDTAFLAESICAGEYFMVNNQQFNQPGTYFIPVPRQNKCDSVVVLTLTINPLPAIHATADANRIEQGSAVQLNVETEELLSYYWQPVNSTLQNPVAVVEAPTWFVVEAADITTSCISVDSVFVDIIVVAAKDSCGADIFIPNAFTPNGDGVNDVFQIRTTSTLKHVQLLIFNRWGNKIFESNDITKGWNGMYKGILAPEDACGYYFYAECENGAVIVRKGNVTVIK